MHQEQWREELSDWLAGFPWMWFCTLTFRPGLSPAQARWRLRTWMDALQSDLGTSEFQWLAVPEHGRTGLAFHFHALVAGLRDRRARQRVEWMRRWFKIGGDARIDAYNAAAGGIRYILKGVGPNHLDNLEIHLNAPLRSATFFGDK
jgi:hypothetical protein